MDPFFSLGETHKSSPYFFTVRHLHGPRGLGPPHSQDLVFFFFFSPFDAFNIVLIKLGRTLFSGEKETLLQEILVNMPFRHPKHCGWDRELGPAFPQPAPRGTAAWDPSPPMKGLRDRRQVFRHNGGGVTGKGPYSPPTPSSLGPHKVVAPGYATARSFLRVGPAAKEPGGAGQARGRSGVRGASGTQSS